MDYHEISYVRAGSEHQDARQQQKQTYPSYFSISLPPAVQGTEAKGRADLQYRMRYLRSIWIKD